MTRKAHLVGAWPGRTPEHAMAHALDTLGPHLVRLSDGETGDRSQWVGPSIETFRANPDVKLVVDGDWSDFEHMSVYEIREGRTLDPDNIHLHYALAFERSFSAFKVLRERYGKPDLRFQVGIPAPIDLAVYAFGPVAFSDSTFVEACTVATVREIAKIEAAAGDDVVFQLETVVGLVGVAQADDDAQPAVAKQVAEGLMQTVAHSPAGSHFGLHLCLGDFHHRSYARMRDVAPLVLLSNAIVDAWPEGRILDYVHAPFAAAVEPPIAEESFYEPLTGLRLPEDVRFIAGFLHETLDLEAHQKLLARIETRVGREVDIAAACGLGRRDTVEEAFGQMREYRALLDSPTS